MQDEATIVDNQQTADQQSIDIKSLLDVANSSKFDETDTLLRGKDTFEKAESFFDLIKSDAGSDNNGVSESDIPVSESADKDNLNEKLNEGLDQEILEKDPSKEVTFISLDEKDAGPDSQVSEASSENEPKKETTFISLDDKDVGSEPKVLETSKIIGSVENESLDVSGMSGANENNDTTFEAVNVVKEVVNSEPDEQEGPDDPEPSQEQSEEYQKGYQDALLEFEKTLEVEKKAVADFSNTLFSVRDEFSDLVEEILIEKAQGISSIFLGELIDVAPEKLIERVRKVSLEVLEKTSETIVELNEIDATAFIENSTDLPFKVVTTPDLGRGEFRIIAGKSGYHQTISN